MTHTLHRTRYRKDETERAQRELILKRAEAIHKQYVELLAAAAQLTSLHEPKTMDYETMKSFMNDADPVVKHEAGWIDMREDLISLGQREEYRGFFFTLVRWLDGLPKTTLSDSLATTATKMQNRSRSTQYLTWLINSVIKFVLLAMSVSGLFVVPIYILTLDGVQNHNGRSIGERKVI